MSDLRDPFQCYDFILRQNRRLAREATVSSSARPHFDRVLSVFGTVAAILLVGLALGALGWTMLAALDVVPWLTLEAGLNGHAAIIAQTGLTVFLVSLCLFLPSHRRVLRLEEAHRSFGLTMDDVARAYAAVHEADRHGPFGLPREFDAVRERIAWLCAHPDLGRLEPAIMDLAAQMSHESRDLAETWSFENVQRARRFLRERREEARRFEERLQNAHAACHDLRRDLDGVDLDEAAARARLDRLTEDLRGLLPRLGLDLVDRPSAEIAAL